jgi:hypothetical protein
MNIFSNLSSKMPKHFRNNDEKTNYKDEIYKLYKDVWDYYDSDQFQDGIRIDIDSFHEFNENKKINKITEIQAMETQFAEFMKRLNNLETDARRDLYGNLSSVDKNLTSIKEILFLNGILEKYHSIDFYLKKFRNRLNDIKKNLFSNQTLEEYPSIKNYLENLQEKINPTKSDNSNGPTEEEDDMRNGRRGGGKPKKTRRKKNKKRRSSRRHKK